ncbi:MAG: hypothetical protein RRA35_01335 [Desulfomonilia bacterium]|nr:hypothetical protein [Desulfomonilia bacterium]
MYERPITIAEEKGTTLVNTFDLVKKALDGKGLSQGELIYLLGLSPASPESYHMMAGACRLSREVSVGNAEVHAQLALNVAPCPLGTAAGANLFWAESGANPRDIVEKTENNRGETVERCRALFWESGWDMLTGPSRHFRQHESAN